MKIVAIVQARMGSSRLPGKVLLSLDKGVTLSLLLDRLTRSQVLNHVVVATSLLPGDDSIATFCKTNNVMCYRGDEKDVLKRYYEAAQLTQADVIVRVTADCPLFDAGLMDEMLRYFQKNSLEVLSNVHPRSYPKGLDTEIFKREALEIAHHYAVLPEEREHVTPYLYHNGRFKVGNYAQKTDLSIHRWTLDYPEDYYFLRRVYHYLENPVASYQEVLNTIIKNPELKQLSERLNQQFL